MSFQEDIKKFLIALLITLAPVLLLNNFIIDHLSRIFGFSSELAFNAFKAIYFMIPFFVVVLSFFVLNRKKELRFVNYLFIGFSIVFLAMSFFMFNWEPNSFNAFLMASVGIALLSLIGFIIYSFVKSKILTWIDEYKKLTLEIIIIFAISLAIITGYICFNASTYNFNQEDLSLEKYQLNKIEKDQTGISENASLFVVRDSLVANEIKEEKLSKNFKEEWSKVINYTNFRGISFLMTFLLILILFWFVYSLFNTKYKVNQPLDEQSTYLSKKEEGYIVNEKNRFQDIELLRMLKGTIVFFTVLIIPIFYASNSPKRVNNNPFINLSKESINTTITRIDTIVVISEPPSTTIDGTTIVWEEVKYKKIDSMIQSINKNERDSIYLHAIWAAQKFYQNRFYKGGLPTEQKVYIDVDSTRKNPKPLNFEKEPANTKK